MAESENPPDNVNATLDGGDNKITDHYLMPSTDHNISNDTPDSELDIGSSKSEVLLPGEINGIEGGKLKKNDSGIDVEKCSSVSGKDGLSSDADCGDSISECYIDSTGLSHSESMSESPESKSEVSPCSYKSDADLSFSDVLDPGNVSFNEGNFVSHSVDTKEDMSELGISGVQTSAADEAVDDDDDDNFAVDFSSKRKRRREHGLLSSSDTDSDDENETGDSSGTGTQSDKRIDSDSNSDEDSEVMNKPWPKHKWRALRDLRKRETGLSNRTPPSQFREMVHGSLQMAQRLKLQYKMEFHEGCVNALHFNRIGELITLWYH